MTDYGHDLRFGAFITPTSQPANHAVDMAIAAEQAGLDLATFQDHPYQQSFLDTSTLLAFVASRTRRIHLAANVASLPLRPPLELARAAATLDVLSKGRFALGIGAGAFWDGIARMGGRTLTPGQGVDALREAIGLIRDSWANMDEPLTRDGAYYPVMNGQRGPRPAHPIPVWVGAYKPRMLTLTGALADGWLPTIEYVDGGRAGIAAGNARIDDSALRAGRSPRDVRRLMNFMRVGMSPAGRGLLQGTAREWTDQLTELALADGISAFIIGGDDPVLLQRFGQDVAPAVREAIERERLVPRHPTSSVPS
ncbi:MULTISPECIES: LLM class flavin-dependent oxidoreductase [unclassified Microbacterium]|uniref:LLM class flavin-dependent oxidoreductase n=1 Tax=unclassified Microbacterium TaxID=2609290 RepID=UPI00214B73B7|nr:MULTISPECIES: LLM class flavin-dependent oxidoreductase [unclassified Microbacterium]MCR2810545.1 LLM class flavin-dependent oxidoreductase [Microbacterium sp. zg.B185]WIM19531.1 LLM class flavin-dependent oxidoreductase [Microbacterium sp. zg-B185]